MHSKNSRVLKFITQTMKFVFYIYIYIYFFFFFWVISYIIRREMDLSRKPYTPCLKHSFDPFSIEGRNSLVLFKILVTQCIEESPSNILDVLAITSFASCIYACMFSLFLFSFYKINLVFSFQHHHLHLLQPDMKGNALADLPDLEKARGNQQLSVVTSSILHLINSTFPQCTYF